MKKILFAMMAALSLAACTSDEVVNVAERQAITFDDAFVDNSTRAVVQNTALDGSYNSNNLEEFQVYGTITGGGKNEGTANIFNGERVVRGNSLGMGDNWSYDAANTQYWIPGNTYNFVAIADGNIKNAAKDISSGNLVTKVTNVILGDYDMPDAIELKDASKQKDILLATPDPILYKEGKQSVNLNFSHLMAKAKFTVKNTIAINSGYTYKVKKITMPSAPKAATYTIESESWSESKGTYSLDFGNITNTPIHDASQEDATMIGYDQGFESAFERLLIPSPKGKSSVINVKYTYELYKDGVLIDTQIETPKAEVTLVPGYAYNFVIELAEPGQPIKFNVNEVKDWNKDHEDYNPGVNTENK